MKLRWYRFIPTYRIDRHVMKYQMRGGRTITLRTIAWVSGGFSILVAALFPLFTDVSPIRTALIAGVFVLVTIADLLVGLGYQQAIRQFSETDQSIKASQDP